MSILDHPQVENTGLYKTSDFGRLDICKLDCETTGRTNPTIDQHEEYALVAKVGVTFWANRAQYSSFRRDAEKQLLAVIHHDILGISAAIRSAIQQGDAEQALHYVDQIDKTIGLK